MVLSTNLKCDDGSWVGNADTNNSEFESHHGLFITLFPALNQVWTVNPKCSFPLFSLHSMDMIFLQIPASYNIKDTPYKPREFLATRPWVPALSLHGKGPMNRDFRLSLTSELQYFPRWLGPLNSTASLCPSYFPDWCSRRTDGLCQDHIPHLDLWKGFARWTSMTDSDKKSPC